MEKYKNLRSKTVFDFCNDAALLEEITECSSVEEHLEQISISAYDERAIAFLELATTTKNKALEAAVRREFAKELKSYEDSFNE